MPATSALMSTISGASRWRREKASSRSIWRAARSVGGHGPFPALVQVRVLPQARLQEGQVAEDGGEDVVEVVGDTAGQLADGLHLLGLAELALRPPGAR